MKSHWVIKLLAITLLAISLVACGSSGGGGGGSSGGGSGGGIESSIVGTWLSACVAEGGASLNNTITFNGGGQGEIIVYGYYDSVCTSVVPSIKIIQFSYSLGAEIPMTGIVKSAYELDITRNSWEVVADGIVIITGPGEPTEYAIVAVEGDILYTSDSSADPGGRPTTFTDFFARQ